MNFDKNTIEETINFFSNNNLIMEVKPISEQKKYIFPDNDLDYNSYRIILLLHICGVKKEKYFENNVIWGRTKFSFYDFLIRHPFYLKKVIEVVAAKSKQKKLLEELNLTEYESQMEFSSMVNYIRGPWDNNYFNVFAYLSSKRLASISYKPIVNEDNKELCISLEKKGLEVGLEIESKELEWVSRMKIINQIFSIDTTSSRIENIISANFPELKI